MSCTSKFSSYVTMTFYFFIIIIIIIIIIINDFVIYPANVTRLELLFFFFTHDQIFVKVFFHYFLTVFILLKNCFNKFKSSVFTSKNKYWSSKFINNANNVVRKTTRNVILMFFLVEPFITFNTL